MENKIDRNQIIGFILVGAILIGFGYFNLNQTPAEETTPQTEEVVSEVEETVSEASPEKEEVIIAEKDTLTGDSAVTPSFQEETFALENDVLKLEWTNKGAQFSLVELKNYTTYDSLPLQIINDQNAIFNTDVKGVNLLEIPFSGEVEGNKISFTSLDGERDVTVVYEIPEKGYQLSMSISGGDIKTNPVFVWEQAALHQEKSIENERQNTTISYVENGDYDYLSPRSTEDDEQLENVKWVSHKQHFFSTILHPERPFSKADVAFKSFEETEERYSKALSSRLTLSGDGTHNFKIYFGPNNYKLLSSFDQEYERIIQLGWGIFGWINRFVVINIFNWLSSYGLSYGIIILLMTIIIKVVLFPMTYSSYKSMAKMKVLKPEMDAINEKFGEKDPMKKQQAVMNLYREAGVNPLGGCIPMLFQFPILLAIFNFFPSSIELRHQSFLWADDLSSYDSILDLPFTIPFYGDHVSLFTLLMTVSTLMYTYMNNQMTAQNNQYPQMKYIMYLMPIVFLGVFNNYAAGLSYYYFVANIITFSQQFAIRRFFINEEAIHAKLQANKTKPKKKSKFAQRMEDLAKQQAKK